MQTIYDSSAEFSMEKIFELYINSHSETINIIELLQYSYIKPKYETMSPCDMKIHTQDDKKIVTNEKEIHNYYMINEQHSVTSYAETAQEQNMCAFYDDDDYVITCDVFMGYPEANNPQFIMEEDFYIDNNNNIDDQDDATAATVDYHIDSINTLLPIDLL